MTHRLLACRSVLTGAQLLSEGLADRGGFATGFDWAAEQLRQAGLHKVAAEVRIFPLTVAVAFIFFCSRQMSP